MGTTYDIENTVNVIRHPYFENKPVMFFEKQQTFLYYYNGFQVWSVGMEIENMTDFLNECAQGEHSALGSGFLLETFNEALDCIFPK